MTAEQLLRQGDLDGALTALQEGVRKAPDDPRLRVFLFQLLCVLGQWQRAIGQLKACVTLDPKANTMAQMYRTAINCEINRESVFRGEKPPLIFGEPEEWLAWMVAALKLQAQGQASAAADLRTRAFEAAPAVSGTLNGTPFAWIADADPRIGPVIELIVNGRYFWVPFTAIRRICMEPPVDLRDRVWMPAAVTWSNGGDAVALIPTRYPGTAEAGDSQQRLARATGWTQDNPWETVGCGQRLLTTDTVEYALMDLRELSLGDTTAFSEPPDGAVSNDG